jgi:AcrR family transcriptional regulator
MSTGDVKDAPRRIRRTPEAARALILEVAARRLAEHGLAGLKIADVAAEAGMSHGTLLHHFGSSDALRLQLATRMAEGLLDEVLAIERDQPDAEAEMERFFERMFRALAGGGHARLIAWLSLEDARAEDLGTLFSSTAERFEALVEVLAQRAAPPAPIETARREARYHVLLVVSSAIGLGVARDVLFSELRLDDDAELDYARWLNHFVRASVERLEGDAPAGGGRSTG